MSIIATLWNIIRIKSLAETENQPLATDYKTTVKRLSKACPALDIKTELVQKILDDIDINPYGCNLKTESFKVEDRYNVGLKEAFEDSPYKVYKAYYREWLREVKPKALSDNTMELIAKYGQENIKSYCR